MQCYKPEGDGKLGTPSDSNIQASPPPYNYWPLIGCLIKEQKEVTVEGLISGHQLQTPLSQILSPPPLSPLPVTSPLQL